MSIPSARCSGSFWSAMRRHATATGGTCCTCTIAVQMTLPAVPVILLDADLDPLIAEKFMPGLRVVEIPVIQQAHIVQVVDRSCSMRFLLGAEDGDEREHKRAARRLSELQQLAVRFLAGCGLLVSYKARARAPAAADRAGDAAPRQFAGAGRLQASRYGRDRRPA